ncbi:MAG: type II secretion system protein GspC [Colwellia sp.]
MPFPTSMTDFTSLFSQLGHKRVAQLTTALILVYIAFVSAKITWSVVPQAQSSQNTSLINKTYNNRNIGKAIDVAKIQSLNLFGLYTENESGTIVAEVSDVPETALNLILSGLVASDVELIAAAIIENQGKQETYGIGDIIKGTRASLEQVLMDRVLIKQSGRLETLMLDGFDYNEPAHKVAGHSAAKRNKANVGPQLSSTNVVDQRNNKELTQSAQGLRHEISSDPAKIGDYLRISPKRKDGEIIGYSLRPGKKPSFFKLAGLKAGDVAVQMNGYDLTAMSQAMQAMVDMKQARDISLLVDRQGDFIEILISL